MLDDLLDQTPGMPPDTDAGAAEHPDSPRHARQLRRSATITAAVGIAHALLLTVGFSVAYGLTPRVNAPAEQIVAFYTDETRRRMVLYAGIFLVPFAGIAYLWFMVSLRMWLLGALDRLDRLLLNLVMVCGTVYVGLLFAAGGALSLVSIDLTTDSGPVSLTMARLFPQYGATLFLIFAMRMAAMTVFAVSGMVRRSAAFPNWFAYAGYPLGLVLLLSASLNPWLVGVFPVWLSLLCVLALRFARRRTAPPPETAETLA